MLGQRPNQICEAPSEAEVGPADYESINYQIMLSVIGLSVEKRSFLFPIVFGGVWKHANRATHTVRFSFQKSCDYKRNVSLCDLSF